ncbi:GNAT family N-acetyltransferase [Iodobacter sp. CM08]|uniref:GNAT family N-acetyltransferase n=1 Tax=Iodobacter sp. CM08 TaxID=3085902 RepID=UPI0029823DEB|nr:GNAT family N-acetyltransferase [Iodobacter sp. CM08]MDW5416229.1 GNAT family N-acetyltransferase [Iodobacter sp. CM08]
MIIRTATDLSDVCMLADEIATTHHQHRPEIFAPAPGQIRDKAQWSSCITAENGAMFIAEISGQIAGFVTVQIGNTHAISFLQPRIICRIGTIVVAQTQQRQGLGRELLSHVEKWAASKHANEVRLEVFKFNPQAIEFYAAQNFLAQSQIMTKQLNYE